MAGLTHIPVMIRDEEQSEQIKLEIAIIENLQREDINAIERAKAFSQLAEQFKLSHGDIAKKVGRSREYVSNTIRLLMLTAEMQQALAEGKITEGHTRPLLMLVDRPEEQQTLYREIILKKITVRDAEQISRRIATDKVRKRERMYDPDIVELENQVSEVLGTRVRVEPTGVGGRILIDFFSQDDVRKILHLLNGEEKNGVLTTTENSTEAEISPKENSEDTLPDQQAGKSDADDDLYAVTNFSV